MCIHVPCHLGLERERGFDVCGHMCCRSNRASVSTRRADRDQPKVRAYGIVVALANVFVLRVHRINLDATHAVAVALMPDEHHIAVLTALGALQFYTLPKHVREESHRAGHARLF
jgi:hypothetical protein